MPYEPVTGIYLTAAEHPEAFEIINLIAEADNRSARQVAEILIVRAGRVRANKIKERKQQAENEDELGQTD